MKITRFDGCPSDMVKSQSCVNVVDVVQKIEKVEVIFLAYSFAIILVSITN